MSKRCRLDQLLVERGLVANRSRARALVMAGNVTVAGQRAAKPGMPVDADADVTVAAPAPYVSRGGEKLAGALDASGVDPAGRTCIDIGASTGGFTDCLLQRGARHVVAVDVGYGQLDYRLRNDPRVIVLERLNARYLRPADLPDHLPAPQILVMDVAFISVTKVLPAATAVCARNAEALLLVKPQFECGPAQVGPGGIVTSASVRRETVRLVGEAAQRDGWQVTATVPSPIRGQGGNWECFLHLRRPPASPEPASLDRMVEGLQVPDD